MANAGTAADLDTSQEAGAACLKPGNYTRLPYGGKTGAINLEVTSVSALRKHPGVQQALATSGSRKERQNAGLLRTVLAGPGMVSN
jgi:hypothetical protein